MTTVTNTLISIIICTRNRAEHLRQTLESLRHVCVPGGLSCELLIVDNGSTDDTAAVAQGCVLPQMPVRSVREGRHGKGYAYNTGLAAARGDVFLLTDDDVRPPQDWIAAMCAPILEGRADAVAGSVSMPPHLRRDWMDAGHFARLAAIPQSATEPPTAMVGANMAFARRVLERVPAFDVELGPGALGFEDESLFSFQLRRAGCRLVAAPNVFVEHHFGEDRLRRAAWLKDAAARGRSSGYVRRHWEHAVIPLVGLQIARKQAQLALGRLLGKARMADPEAVSEWELKHLQHIHMLRQYRHERRRPPNYDRFGLVKRRGPGAQEAP